MRTIFCHVRSNLDVDAIFVSRVFLLAQFRVLVDQHLSIISVVIRYISAEQCTSDFKSDVR